MNIKNAHANTCKWLNQKQEYLDWLDPLKLQDHHGFLWIKGKPVTGKSTLMKFALARARESMKDTVIASFFFNARGGDLEKSTIWMYRSLLLQLADGVPEIGQMLYVASRLDSWSKEDKIDWTLETLKGLLGKAVELPAHNLSYPAVSFRTGTMSMDPDDLKKAIQLRPAHAVPNQWIQRAWSSRTAG